jgi:hypothetical protein
MGAIFGGGGGGSVAIPPPPPAPPPPPNPPTPANASVQAAGVAETRAAQAAAGQGFEDTLETGPQGAATPATAGKNLLGE